MVRTNLLSHIVTGFVVLFMSVSALAVEQQRLDAATVLAVVPVKGGNVDKAVYRQFDRLVPDLKKIAKNKIVKLECRFSGQPEREQDVENAYKIAARIEKYLRVHHKLALDLWVSVDITQKPSNPAPVLTIAVFSDDMKKLDAERVDPVKK